MKRILAILSIVFVAAITCSSANAGLVSGAVKGMGKGIKSVGGCVDRGAKGLGKGVKSTFGGIGKAAKSVF